MYIINPEGTLVYMGAIHSIRSANQADIAKAKIMLPSHWTLSWQVKKIEVNMTRAYGCDVKY